MESLFSVHIGVLVGGDAGSLCDFAASTSVSTPGQIDPIGEIGRRCFAEHDAMLAGQLGFVYNILNRPMYPTNVFLLRYFSPADSLQVNAKKI